MASVVRRSRRIGIRGIVVGRLTPGQVCGAAVTSRLPRRSLSPAAVSLPAADFSGLAGAYHAVYG